MTEKPKKPLAWMGKGFIRHANAPDLSVLYEVVNFGLEWTVNASAGGFNETLGRFGSWDAARDMAEAHYDAIAAQE